MKSSRGGGDGEAFLALVTKSVWFKVDEVSMSQSVSRLEAMVPWSEYCHAASRSYKGHRDTSNHAFGPTQCSRSLTIHYEEQEQANEVPGGTSV